MKVGGALALERLLYIVKGNLERLFSVPVRIKRMSEYFFSFVLTGDYFGILMEQKVIGFPFNVMDNPMYWGSTANYLGLALM